MQPIPSIFSVASKYEYIQVNFEKQWPLLQ